MRQCAADVDLFIAVSKYYQSLMMEKLAMEPHHIKQVYPGLNPADYKPATQKPVELVIGFLARMCQENGLDILVDAAAILVKENPEGSVRLRIAGGKTSADKAYLRRIEQTIEQQGLAGHVEWMDDFGSESRKAFLRDLSLLCVPFRNPAASGLSVQEAMACGTGFVEPKAGVFVELVQLSQAGVLYEPNTPEALAELLRQVFARPGAVADMGQKARHAVEVHFNIETTCRSMIELMEGVIG
jgi:glycosyltransferase involved in cell wall biosynthesis